MQKPIRALPVLVSLAVFAAIPSALSAQVVVGHTPQTTPYHDIDAVQRITVFGGYFQAQGDGLNTSPQSGPAFGLRYDLPVAGPGDFYVRIQRANSWRDAYNPTLTGAARSLGRQNLALYSGDLGFGLNLTGRRTWHGLIPTIDFGLGIVSASGTTANDPYSFGTQFAFSTGFGIRYNPRNSFELRFDAGPTFYQNHNPAAYFVTPTGGTPLLSNTASRSGYQHSVSYTAGLVIPIFR
ncbi:MAG: hypothetical protein ABI026_11870 [Gemmatimonadaceae bacterium]